MKNILVSDTEHDGEKMPWMPYRGLSGLVDFPGLFKVTLLLHTLTFQRRGLHFLQETVRSFRAEKHVRFGATGEH